MAEPVISVRTAAIARLAEPASLPDGEQVLDHMPDRLKLPYVAFQRCSIVSIQKIRKGKRLFTVALFYQVVTNPHDAAAKTLDDLILEVADAMGVPLDLSADGFTNNDQVLHNVEPFLQIDPDGAELKRAHLRWEIEVL